MLAVFQFKTVHDSKEHHQMMWFYNSITRNERYTFMFTVIDQPTTEGALLDILPGDKKGPTYLTQATPRLLNDQDNKSQRVIVLFYYGRDIPVSV